MRLIEYRHGKTLLTGKRVAVLGFFDGVHLAHRRLIGIAVSEAKKRGIECAVFTFSTASKTFKRGSGRLYSEEDRLALFQSLGIECVITADFEDVRSLGAEQFVFDVLIGELGVTLAVSGFNFRFGMGANADAEKLVRLMRARGGDAIIDQGYLIEGLLLSTTYIKSLLQKGETALANRYLGTPYFLSGRVEHGRHLGRGYGIPTVNLPFEEGMFVPREGVYRSAVSLRGMLYHGITNIGKCPTFGERPIHSETYLIDADVDAYGETIRVYLLGFLRDEITFPDVDSLKMQILIDKKRAIKENGDIKWLANGQN